ncbi:hypothetical protein COMNV_00570 [Commensalibacter sp. Nvir]|nr:hypothetical protein COMNV_00570 [Commensalibacter sp. Nvir]
MINNQKIFVSLEGLSNLFNNFVELVEEKQISLPPPFKTYESNLLNDQAIKHLSKPTQTKISNTSLQNALIALSKIDCQKAAESLINIVSSCYKNMNNTNDSIDTCVAEDNFASVWLYFSKHSLSQKQLSTNSNFFSEKQRFIRIEQYMDSRFDDSEKNTNYFMPFHTFDFMKYLNQKCRPI